MQRGEGGGKGWGLAGRYKKEAVGEQFLLPDAWLPDAKSVISFFIPFTDEVKKKLTDSFIKQYLEQKQKMVPVVIRIVADRNAKTEAIAVAKQKLVEAYEMARQELAETYPRELVDKCLMPHFYYASPKAFADVPVGVADRSLSLSGYDIRFFIDNLEVGELNDFSLDELSSKIKQLCVEHKSEHLSALLEVPSDASEGVVYDIKQVLREGYVLRLNLVQDSQD